METKLEREDEVGLLCQDHVSRASSQRVPRNRPEMQRSAEKEELEELRGLPVRTKGTQRTAVLCCLGGALPKRVEVP